MFEPLLTKKVTYVNKPMSTIYSLFYAPLFHVATVLSLYLAHVRLNHKFGVQTQLEGEIYLHGIHLTC